jgi:hypothetical protein
MRGKSELSTEVKKFETKGLAPVYSIEIRYITELVFVICICIYIYIYVSMTTRKKKHEAFVTYNGSLIW